MNCINIFNIFRQKRKNTETIEYTEYVIDENEIMEKLKNDGMFLGKIKEKYIKYDMCECAIKQNGFALEYVPKESIDNKLIKLALEYNKWTLLLIPSKFITEKMIMESVNENDSFTLLYFIINRNDIDKKLITQNIIEEFVKFNYFAFLSVPENMITYEMCKYVLHKYPKFLEYIPSCYIDSELCNIAMKNIDDKKYFEYNIFISSKSINKPNKYELYSILKIKN